MRWEPKMRIESQVCQKFYICFGLIWVLLFVSCKVQSTAHDWVGVETEATDGGKWTLQAVTADGAHIPIIGVQREPTLIEHSNELVEARVSCGSPCNYSYFVDLENDTISRAFEYVIGLNINRHVVATAEEDDISLYNIFREGKMLQKIKLDFAPVAALVTAIEEVRFTEDGDLYIRYLSGGDFKTKEDTVSITYKQLDQVQY